MIRCSVCNTENDDLSVRCVSCKGFLQSKLDALSLFSTSWGIIESPRRTFKTIALASHKNYVLLLASLIGIALVFGFFWTHVWGNRFVSVFSLVGFVMITGPFVGLLFVVFMSFIAQRMIRLLRGKSSFKNVFAVFVYAWVPILMGLMVIFPNAIAVFGLDFFGNNPPPSIIEPTVYCMLIGFHAITILWSGFLMLEGFKVVSGFPYGKALVVLLVPGIHAAGLFVGLSWL